MNIVILVNKDFEYEGYRKGFDCRMKDFEAPHIKVLSKDLSTGPNKMTPSYEYFFGKDHIAKEYCISYMFRDPKNTSSSQVKHALLNYLIGNVIEDKIDFIMIVRTSKSTPESQGGDSETHSVNGCVFLGNRFFARDCRDIDPTSGSYLTVPAKFDVCGEIYPGFYEDMADERNKKIIMDGMMKVQNKPAEELYVDADEKNACLGVINVIDYKKYENADEATYKMFKETSPYNDIPAGLETTHAVVKIVADENNKIPVLFVSPITDRYKKFVPDVDDKQNHDCSYNAGVVVANLMEFMAEKMV